MHGEAHRVGARLAQPPLKQRPEPGGHGDPPEDPRLHAGQLRTGRARRRTDGPRVRNRHRYAVDPDRETHAELVDEPLHRRRHTLPLQIRLTTVHQEEPRALRVLHQVDHEPRLVVVGPVVLVEDHHRSPRTVAQQPVAQVVRRELAGAPRVDESVEQVDEDRAVCAGSARQAGSDVSVEVVDVLRVEHRLLLGCRRLGPLVRAAHVATTLRPG